MSRCSALLVILVTVLCWPVLGEDCRFPDCVEPGPEDLPIIWGKVVDDQGAELPGVTVTIHGGHGPAMVSISDGEGRFLFRRVPGGFWDVTAELPGFGTAERTEVLAGDERTEAVMFALVPVLGEARLSRGMQCRDEPAIGADDLPSCDEYVHHSGLIDRSKQGDPDATRELRERFASTVSRVERQRLAAELIRRLEDDEIYLDFLLADAERLMALTMHAPASDRGDERPTPLEAHAAERGLEPWQVSGPGLGALSVLASLRDERLLPLFSRALESRDETVLFYGFLGFAELRADEAAPRILAAIERGELDPGYVWPFLYLFDDAALRALADEASADDPTRDKQLSWMKEEHPWMRLPGEE